MIDYLLSFETEAAALAALTGTPFVINTGDGLAWNASTVFPALKLYTQTAAYDAEGNETAQAVLIDAQFWLVISQDAPAPDETITALDACQVAANREAALAGEPFIYQTGLRADPAVIATIARIDGLPAGSAYPFGEARIIP